MPVYKVTDPQTGVTLRLEGESPPTEQELIDIFSRFQNKQQGPSIQTPFGESAQEIAQSSPEELEQLSSAAKEQLARFGTQMAFGVPAAIEGGTVGAAGGPVGATLGAIVGFGAGAMGGEGVFQTGQHLGIAPGEAPETSEEALQRMAEVSSMSTTGDAIFRGGGRAVRNVKEKLASGLRPDVSEVAKETREVLSLPAKTVVGREAQEEGIGFTLGQTLDNQAIDNAEELISNTWTGSRAVRGLADRTEKFLASEMEGYVDNLLQTIGPERTGDLAQQAIENNLAHKSLVINGLFKKLENGLAKGGTVETAFGPKQVSDFVPTNNIKQMAQEELAKMKGSPSSRELRNALEEILEIPERISFREAQNMRSRFLAVTRSASDVAPDLTVGTSKQMSKSIDNAMNESFDSLIKTVPNEERGQLREIWRSANSLVKKKKDLFNDPFIKTLANKDPDILLDKLTASTNADAVLRAKEAISDPKTWNEIQGGFLMRFLNRARRSPGGDQTIAGENLITALDKVKPSVKKAFFSDNPKAFENFEKMARAMARAQSTAKGSGGGLMGNFMQARAAGNVVRGSSFGSLAMFIGDTALLTAPGRLSRLFTNQKIVNAIVDGVKLDPTKQNELAMLGRITGLLSKSGVDFKVRSRDQVLQEEQNVDARTPFSGLAQSFGGR